MSQNLHWAPRSPGHVLWDLQLKRLLTDECVLEGGSAGRRPVGLDSRDVQGLKEMKEGLNAEGQREVDALIAAIAQHGEIELWLQ